MRYKEITPVVEKKQRKKKSRAYSGGWFYPGYGWFGSDGSSGDGGGGGESAVHENFYVDVPNEEWLQDKIDYAKSKPRNSYGVPYLGSTTAYARNNVRVPVEILKQLPGMRGEQKNIRKDDLFAIMKIMKDTNKLPLTDRGEEYAPFINVAYNGEAWVNEGNHRIMAAAALGWKDMPVQISYFDGGERIKSGAMYPGRLGLGGTLDEAPLADYQPMGDFNKPGPFRGPDKKLVTHPVNQLKTARFFEQTPYDFRLFFSNIPGTGRYSEYGQMEPRVIEEIFKDQAAPIIQGSENAITVVFVGNKGDSKVPMTPWIMAHRIGHAIQAGQRMGRAKGPWQAAEEHFFTTVNSIIADYYGRQPRGSEFRAGAMKNDLSKEYTALFNAIGTQRSSRTGQISRPYEFLYELFAQYLGTGNITLKPLPRQQDYGRKAWGRSTQSLRLQPGAEEDSTYATEVLGRDMELMFDDVLSSLVGRILVM